MGKFIFYRPRLQGLLGRSQQEPWRRRRGGLCSGHRGGYETVLVYSEESRQEEGSVTGYGVEMYKEIL